MSKKKVNPFVMLDSSMIKSDVWADLSGSERDAYIRIKANYNGSNNGEIHLSYNSVKRLMSKATFAKAIKTLAEKGWIEIEKGGLMHQPNKYTLTGKYDYVKRSKRNRYG